MQIVITVIFLLYFNSKFNFRTTLVVRGHRKIRLRSIIHNLDSVRGGCIQTTIHRLGNQGNIIISCPFIYISTVPR